MTVPRSLALALCLALAAATTARAQGQLFSCSSLPSNWGSDSDSNDNSNGPWEDLSADPSDAIYEQIYNTIVSRYSSKPIPGWAGCSDWNATAVGCQQTAGLGENYALQVNFTCTNASGAAIALGTTVDVNVYQQYINVDDLDVEFVAVDGEIVVGNLDSSNWWEANDNIWGDWYQFNGNDNNDSNDEDQEDDNNSDNDYFDRGNAAIGQAASQIGQQVASGEISGQEAGQMWQQIGQQIGQQFANGRK